jgi:hypothetical protein
VSQNVAVPADTDQTVTLIARDGPRHADDPDANFKTDVALYSKVDALSTLTALGENLGIPLGALVRYVLGKFATGGSSAALELGQSATLRLAGYIDEAESAGTDEARLAAYESLRGYISWLRLPFDRPDIY